MARHRALAAIAVVLLAGAVPSAALVAVERTDDGTERATKRDPRYETQRGTFGGGRQAHTKAHADELVDSAAETCGALGVAGLAARYGVAADPEVVARRFARSHQPAFRQSVLDGCLQGLRHGG